MGLKKTILFNYKGIISFNVKQQLCSEILELEEIECKRISEKKRLRYLLDECLTNMHNYYKISDLTDHEIVLNLYEAGNSLIFQFRNIIYINDINALSDYIVQINNSNESELKKLMVKTLNRKQEKNMMGAGLGLITIKQRLKCDLVCQFLGLNKSMKMLKLSVTVNS